MNREKDANGYSERGNWFSFFNQVIQNNKNYVIMK